MNPPANEANLDKYERMLQLANGFDSTGEQLRDWARLGTEILRDDDVTDSGELSPKTWARAEQEVHAATLGKQGLLNRGVELDADALVVRATVLTYRWIDELQDAAYRNLGAVAGRAIGYLAPEVELGGSLVSAGLIETDALDRDAVTAYLGELAADHPELMEHIATGGGSLLESLQLRSLMTAGLPHGEQAALATAGALRAVSVGPFAADVGHALRDVAGELVAEPVESVEQSADGLGAPQSLEELMRTLEEVTTSVSVHRTRPGRYIAYLPGPYARGGGRGRLRLVSGDVTAYTQEAARTIEQTVEPGARLMLVGSAAGGTTAAALAAQPSAAYAIEQVVTVGAPGAAAPRVPESTRVLSLEDRADPIALLGGLINASTPHRLTVVYDGSAARSESPYVVGGRAADTASHPELRAEIARIRDLGYLA